MILDAPEPEDHQPPDGYCRASVCSPKIIQILIAPNDATWQGILLGLGDDGVTYQVGTGTKWEPMIPTINSKDHK